MLTARQKQVLDFIVAYQSEHGGVSPFQPEIQRAFGFSSKSRVFHILRGLEERGFIRKGVGHRAIEVLRITPTPPIPVYDAKTLKIREWLP